MIISVSKTTLSLTSWLESLSTWVFHDVLNVLHIWLLTCVPDFNFLAWFVKNHPVIISDSGGHLGFLTGGMEDMGHPWPHNCSWHFIPSLHAKFQHSSMIRSVSRTGILGGRWGFLTEDLEDRVILDTMDHLGGPHGSYTESFVIIFIFGWDIRVCYIGNKNVTDRQTNKPAKTTQIYMRFQI